MAEFIIEYVLVQKRVARILCASKEDALEDIQRYHEQYDSDKLNEVVMILSLDEDVDVPNDVLPND